MARSSLTDYLTTYPFWLMDVAPISGLAIPIFMPLSGFSAISAPEVSHEIETIKEGNWYFKNKVIKGADITPITLKRGATATNSDFWRWMHAATKGNTNAASIGSTNSNLPSNLSVGGPTYRRTLVLIQFFSHSRLLNELTSDAARAAASIAESAAIAGTAVALGGSGAGAVAFAAGSTAAVGAANLLLGGTHSEASEFALRIPAKAWILYGCIPMRYNATSAFDASSAAVSIQELDIAVEYFEEISLLG